MHKYYALMLIALELIVFTLSITTAYLLGVFNTEHQNTSEDIFPKYITGYIGNPMYDFGNAYHLYFCGIMNDKVILQEVYVSLSDAHLLPMIFIDCIQNTSITIRNDNKYIYNITLINFTKNSIEIKLMRNEND